MASIEFIAHTPRRPEIHEGKVRWTQTKDKPFDRLPQICWENGSTWSEANIWALEMATSSRKNIKTVACSMRDLLTYANWLEVETIDWWHFPARESDRCLPKFRGALVRARDAGDLAPSTVTRCMATVVRFYRWLRHTGLLSPGWPMWTERRIGIKLKDGFGLEHTLRVNSTDLAIPNRKAAGAFQLEEGLLPVSIAGMRSILELADSESSEELALMLRIGFQTGLRLGSITDLKVQTLLNASIDPVAGWHRLEVGPGARPPVGTKSSVSGMVPIPSELLERLCQYSTSVRRLKRQVKATSRIGDLLFLTRFGNSYGGDESRAVNVEMVRLRDAGKRAGLDVLNEFHFHRSRATFATELMRVALRCLPVGDAVTLVREACLHKDEATTLRYVRFIERSKAMAEAANAFTEAFLGLALARGEKHV